MDFVFNFDPHIAFRFGEKCRYYEPGSDGGTTPGSYTEMVKLYKNIMANYAYINLRDYSEVSEEVEVEKKYNLRLG